MTTATSLEEAKKIVWNALAALPGNTADHATVTSAAPALAEFFDPQCEWHTFHPINVLHGIAEIESGFWQPLLRAMPDMERRTQLFFGGEFDGRFCGGAGTWVTAHGYLTGTFTHDWLGIPATGKQLYVRIGEFYRVEGGRIVDARVLLDLVDVMRQAGFAVLPPSQGLDLLVPGPQYNDGVLLQPQPDAQTEASMKVLDSLISGLGTFDKSDLRSMDMRTCWHPEMMWYGPGGIGTARRVEGFQKYHQAPFLEAFPDRRGGGHISRIAEGHYVGSTGWPSVAATHLGDYLGVPSTNKPITMRVADWWRREGDVFRENWVMIDIPELLLQMGVDVFARMREQVANAAVNRDATARSQAS